ncbi:MAG: sodium:solute symporter [Flavobacteriaceae bacterium]|nr:sodium:solute symporter [Flavobacteriaceae bacterium]
MQPIYLFAILILYFGILLAIAYRTGKDDSNAAFFSANRNSRWYLVAFGMIGTSLSGVTFISVPGWVQSTQFSYMQIVFGYLLGYIVIAFLLIPIYYSLKITSIYEYLQRRFGLVSQKTGAALFMVSRLLISAFRLFLVASVLQYFILDSWNIPFEATVIFSVALIWLYTNRGGIKTIVYTDLFQTTFMLAALVGSVWILMNKLNYSLPELIHSDQYRKYSQFLFWDDWKDRKNFFKSVIGGMFIAIAMTGLDQDNMQKNLTCNNTKEAKWNLLSLGVVLIFVNFIFLFLGALLFMFAEKNGIQIPVVEGKSTTDLLYPEIAINGKLGFPIAVIFFMGLISAALSSADGALTSLTTSYSIDFINIEKHPPEKQKRIRKQVHLGISVVLILVIILFRYILEENVISTLLQVTTYTYGPLLGLFAFGIFTPYKIKEQFLPWIAILSVVFTVLLNKYIGNFIEGFNFGYEILAINGLFTFLSLFLVKRKNV